MEILYFLVLLSMVGVILLTTLKSKVLRLIVALPLLVLCTHIVVLSLLGS